MREPDRIPLANLPTPLVRPENLCRRLGGADLWIKRDDLTGLEFSGNKIRKLEFILAAAHSAGDDTLVTEGTCQSNHCRATAAACARLGLRAHLLFRPLPPGAPQGNHLLDVLFGAKTEHYSREQYSAERAALVERALQRLRDSGRRPRFTPAGASEPLGCWGYIRAMGELAEQFAQAGLRGGDIVVAVSSGGTYAGMLLGKLLHKLDDWRVWAVPVSDDVGYHQREVGALCRAAIAQFALEVHFDERELRFIDGYLGRGYAIPYREAATVVRTLAECEGLLLDPVYTAKAFAALEDGIRNGQFGRRQPVVFVHTGGAFSNFAWPDTLLEPARLEPRGR